MLAIAKLFWKEILLGVLLLGFITSIGVHLRKDRKTEEALMASEAARAAAIAIWSAEIDRLTRDLADAKEAGERAVAEKAAAEAAAKKAVAAERKKWQRVYDSKPENRAWADAKPPADVLAGLRQRP